MSIKQIAATVALLGERPDEYPRWPWATFNREVGGLPPGRLTVIGARPGQGKTTVLLNAVRRWLEDGLKVCYLGTEQSFEETWQLLQVRPFVPRLWKNGVVTSIGPLVL